MNGNSSAKISEDMTLLEIISEYPATEAVFKSYDERAHVCICCQMLFETVRQVAEIYKLDLEELLAQLNAVATI